MVEKQEKDYQRNKVIEKAVEAANRIIMDSSSGSEEETNYLTAEVAKRIMQTALYPFYAAILRKDIEDYESGS